MTVRSRDEGLVRGIGVVALTASIINGVLGAGIFVLPATAAGLLGPAAPLAFLSCAVLMMFVTLCFAAGGSRVATSGGPYGVVGAAFGPFAGYLAGFALWLSSVLGAGGVIAAFVDVLGSAGLGPAGPWTRAAVIVLVYAGFAWINIRGVRAAAGVVTVTTAAKLIPVLLFVIAGATMADWDNLRFEAAAALPGLGRASAAVIFAFVGMEIAMGASGEVRAPARTVPRALLAGMAFITVLYLAIQAVAQGLLGGALAASRAPLADALSSVTAVGGAIVLIGSAVSMLGYIAGDLLGMSRLPFAFARDGVFPRGLGTVHPRYHTPYAAIGLHAVTCTVLAISGSFASLAVMSGIAVSALYFACCAAAWRLQRYGVAQQGDPFVLPLGGLIPVAGMLSTTWLMAQATALEAAALGGAIAVGALCYLVARLRVRAAEAA